MKRNKLSLLLEGDAKANGDVPPEGNRVTEGEGSINLDQEAESLALMNNSERLTKLIQKEPAVKRVVRQAARIADMITDEDRVKAKQVITEALGATSWRAACKGEVGGRGVQEPDYKTRLAAATLQLAYDEGLPVKRSVVLTGNFANAEELAQALRSSPEAEKALKTLAGLGIAIENEGEIIEMEANNGEDGELSNDQEDEANGGAA